MLGSRVGYIVGIFEALRYYQQHDDGDDDRQIGEEGEVEGEGGEERGDKLWREAKRVLRMDQIFGENFFDRDGVWKFDLGDGGRQGRGELEERRDHGGAGVSAGEKNQGEEKGEEREGRVLVTFFDVADSHPLIKEWMQKAKDELKRCGVDDRGTIEVESQ